MFNSKIKIGVVAVGYQCEQYLDKVLEPWINLKLKSTDLDIKICATTALFKEKHELGFKYDNKTTEDILSNYKKNKCIDEFVVVKEPILDFESRNYCWRYLCDFDLDLTWQLDLFDELYTEENIFRILTYIKNNEFVDWYRVNFKNYIGDTKHYIEGFAPPRIHWVNRNGGIDKWYWDNNLQYKNKKRDIEVTSVTIPKHIAMVKHYSWCGSAEFLKAKIAYQKKAINCCSYEYSEEKGLIFDKFYYNRINEDPPKVFFEE